MSDSRPPVVVYSKPNCVQCNATYRFLSMNGVEYRSVNVEDDPVAFDFVKSLGYAAVPVVVVPAGYPNAGWHWSGFQPEMLALLFE